MKCKLRQAEWRLSVEEAMVVCTFKSTISFFAASSSFLIPSSADSVDVASDSSEGFSDPLSVFAACSVEYNRREQGRDTRFDEADMVYSCCRSRILCTRAARADIEVSRVLLSCACRAAPRRDLRIVTRDMVLAEITVCEGDGLECLQS